MLPLSEVAVTATRSERETFDTPQAVNVITNRMIVESNAGTTPDVLTGEAGVLIQKSNTGGGSPFIRGLTGKQVLILVDGVRVNNSYYRFGPHQYLNTVDPYNIGRIEVVHGPGSVLYGSDALGGVINIVTRRGSYSDGTVSREGLFALRGATADRSVGGHAQFQHSQGDLSVIGGVSLKRFDDLRGGQGVGTQVPTGYDEGSGNLRVSHRIGPDQELTFVHQYLRQWDVPKTNEVTLGTRSKFNYEPQVNSLSYLRYQASDVKNLAFDDASLTVSFNRQKEGEEIVERAAPTIETREITDVRTVGVTGQFTKRIGASHRLTYGFDYYDDRYDTSKTRLDLAAGTQGSIAPGTPDGATYRTTGVFLQDEIRIGEFAEIIPGLRFSEFSSEGTIGARQLNLKASKTTGSLMGVLRLSDRLNLVGGLAQGFRAPNMEDFFGRVDFVSEIPNDELRPETSLNREIGLKYLSQDVSANVQVFDSTYRDLITRVAVAPNVRQRQNLRRARIDGVEASLRYLLGTGWALRGAVAYARGNDEDTNESLQRIPPLTGSVHLRYQAGPGAWYGVSSVFARRQDRLSPEDRTDPRIPIGGTPGYVIFNLAAGFRPAAGQEVILSLENIGNTKYKTHGSAVFGPGTNLVLSYLIRV